MSAEGEQEMQGHSRKILVVNSTWAGIFASLFVALVGFLGTFVMNANAAITVLQHDMKNITESKLDERLARMEEKQDWVIRTLTGSNYNKKR